MAEQPLFVVPDLPTTGFKGRPLTTLYGEPMELGRFLTLAIQLASTLALAHKRQLIHQHLRPQAILIDDATGKVYLTQFAQNTLPTSDAQGTTGNLPEYQAPEQTGRLRWSIDERTDLYSLGVILYELLTDAPLFQATDPLEWAHCHVARWPIPPHILNPAIPMIVNDIVMKLLAKSADERYQSAIGLRYDLEQCLFKRTTDGQIDGFPLGTHDRSGRLVFPQQLYGRDAEIAALMQAFEAVNEQDTPRLVLVGGYSGVGKSVLVAELHQPIVKRHGYFISGKFDQFQRGVPYAAIAVAFRTLIQQILTESEQRIERWRQRIRAALGNNAQLIVDMVPQLGLIIGPQAPIEDLPPAEAQKRLHRVFLQFVGIFTTSEAPLVIFLDDLQWMDSESFTLLTQMAMPSNGCYRLLLIGAYRDNEIGPMHPLFTMQEELKRGGGIVQNITLKPLAQRHLQQILADTLHVSFAEVESLARIVYTKTQGNPFFFFQFVQTLHQDGLLSFDSEQRVWCWDTELLRTRQFTENVLELMLTELQRLPSDTQSVLQRAGLLGNEFEQHTLALATELSDAEVAKALWPALHVGLIVRQGSRYQFLHDRVQEAACALIPSDQLAQLHLHIGRLLYQQLSPAEQQEQIFAIASHFNHALDTMSDAEERRNIALLNLEAGKQAHARTVYAVAREYFSKGTELLTATSWQDDYDLTLQLYLYRAECEYLVGNFAVAEPLLDMLLDKAQQPQERVQIYGLKTYLYVTQGQIEKACRNGLQNLKELGLDLPIFPSDEEVEQEHQAILQELGDRSIESLVDHPKAMDQHIQLLLRAMAVLDAASFYFSPNLYSMRVYRMTLLSLRHGHTEDTIHAYSHFGYLLASNYGEYQSGYAFTHLAIQLRERFGSARYLGQVQYFHGLTAFWVRPLDVAISLQRDIFHVLVNHGEIAYSSMCSTYLIANLLGTGKHLSEVEQETAQRLAFVRDVQFHDVADMLLPVQQMIRMLRGLTYSPYTFDDGAFDENEFEAALTPERMPLLICRYQITRLMSAYLMGNYVDALRALEIAEPILWSVKGFQETHDFTYYAALTLTACYHQADSETQARWFQRLLAYQERMQLWLENNPNTFQPTAYIVFAEISRIERHDFDTMRLYDQAIESARKYGFVQHQAIANECAARFYSQYQFTTNANAYLAEARSCYSLWGADAKVRQIDEHSPHLLQTSPVVNQVLPTTIDHLDRFAAIKASQAISSELSLHTLLDTLMRVTLEQSGADYGVIITNITTEGYHLAAEARVLGQNVSVILDQNLNQHDIVLPKQVIAYVQRTCEPFVLDTENSPISFAADIQNLAHAPQSILCLPVLRQTKFVGVLYLENRLVKGAFTAERLDVLRVLVAQAAISLENAQLYSNLRHENAERRRAEARIMSALAEKELLLGEIHHRVKNNLQVISSLFSLQTEAIKDQQARSLLRASENRVRAMALIHERLYRFNDLEIIDFTIYIHDLVIALYQAYGINPNQISFELTSNDVTLGIDSAISCGLIVNELVTNALRHAFPNNRTGCISISFEQNTLGHYQLTVSDNGIGLAPDSLSAPVGHIGLVLVQELVEQLGGTFEPTSSPQGTTIVVRFHSSGTLDI